ncbi:hypothetical protein P175DRAFT_0489737 [Aspergillus ochraceoroseus IBT 24754]|uniref:ABM domain-containing protein n=1 Tax=Aspergillus ochraceoroseus IBT 24754 TaxID=1392256 RepID=A0A2T5M7Y9_9EURO|nr:uncharacterized protein P175DRAFT_0489737 [Aspergillus ochraceoroseus IBT 24754]PTU24633.1 hypothetical protein P175DRAFT_0489737 [Aspergillus ochraceoroseus IBT 24754]
MSEDQSKDNLDDDLEVVVWTELQVPPGREESQEQWAGYFQPLVYADGHSQTIWARSKQHSEIVLVATLWHEASQLRRFKSSPSAQLYWEALLNSGTKPLSYHEIQGSCTLRATEAWDRRRQEACGKVPSCTPRPYNYSDMTSCRFWLTKRPMWISFGLAFARLAEVVRFDDGNREVGD